MNADEPDWLPTGNETVPWRQRQRGGTREDRTLTEISASVPPMIARRDYVVPLDLLRASEDALVAIAGMDASAADSPAEMTRFMVRTESVASSKIERVTASSEDFARALVGSRGNDSATSMVAGSAAIGTLIDAEGVRGVVELEDVIAAHRVLMIDDRDEGPHAGTIRDEQNWIGGSDYSPRGAWHIPPVPARVPELMRDLVEFSNRDDIPVLAQVTIAHAQFETIHPFGDGNGRIGRALVGAILRRRGVMRNTIVPVASALNARRGEYFDALTEYRRGRVTPLLSLMARSMRASGEQGRVSIERMKAMPSDWHDRAAVRADSTADRILGALFQTPVMTMAQLSAAAGTSHPQVYAAMDKLEDLEIVTEITGRKRDRVWAATDIMAELDDLDARIAAAMR